MTKTKRHSFDFEWWVVQKRAIYILIGVLALCGMAAGAGLYVWKYGNPLRNVGIKSNMTSGARFISFEGDVRVLRASTRENVAASSQIPLDPGDTVQTGADGRARIQMIDGSTVLVRPNSTLIIRDNTSAEEGKKTNVRVVVATGQINVHTEDQPEGTSNVVETRQTQNKLAPQTGATFGVNPDNTEEIRVEQGKIETTTNNGEKTAVAGGEYVAVNPSGSIGSRDRLLAIPAPLEPRDLDKVSVSENGSASVTLHWQRPASGNVSFYRVEVATSPFFVADGKVIERDQLAATELKASDLRPGVYFWRVRATATSGQTSDWSEPRKFAIVPKGTGERVSVTDWQAVLVGGQIYLIRGRAQPGTSIRIAGRETSVNGDGTFQLQITAPEGAREVVAEAQDQQGNRDQYKIPLSGAK
ncbi:MAG: FecR domain-containing protein [Pyrinomonadaceae bacterium]